MRLPSQCGCQFVVCCLLAIYQVVVRLLGVFSRWLGSLVA
jgi:hypothetical protein